MNFFVLILQSLLAFRVAQKTFLQVFDQTDNAKIHVVVFYADSVV